MKSLRKGRFEVDYAQLLNLTISAFTMAVVSVYVRQHVCVRVTHECVCADEYFLMFKW